MTKASCSCGIKWFLDGLRHSCVHLAHCSCHQRHRQFPNISSRQRLLLELVVLAQQRRQGRLCCSLLRVLLLQPGRHLHLLLQSHPDGGSSPSSRNARTSAAATWTGRLSSDELVAVSVAAEIPGERHEDSHLSDAILCHLLVPKQCLLPTAERCRRAVQLSRLLRDGVPDKPRDCLEDVSEMTYFVSSGTSNLKSIDERDGVHNVLEVTKTSHTVQDVTP